MLVLLVHMLGWGEHVAARGQLEWTFSSFSMGPDYLTQVPGLEADHYILINRWTHIIKKIVSFNSLNSYRKPSRMTWWTNQELHMFWKGFFYIVWNRHSDRPNSGHTCKSVKRVWLLQLRSDKMHVLQETVAQVPGQKKVLSWHNQQLHTKMMLKLLKQTYYRKLGHSIKII